MKISPDTFDKEGNRSPGELRLFKALSEAEGTPNWLVFHSLEIAQHKTRLQGEADFVFLVPGKGVLVVEVKDHHEIRFDGHNWQLGSNKETRGPFKQADDAKWSIRNHLDKRDIDTYDIPFVHAVWFTSIPRARIPSSVEWSEEQVFSIEDLSGNIAKTIEDRIELLVEQTGIVFSNKKAPLEKLEKIGQALRPRFVARESVQNREQRLFDFLNRALESQVNRYELLRPLPLVLLDGLAGTGKTFIAEHFARVANEEQEKTLFVCFNKLLSKKISDDLSDCDYVEVSTIHALMVAISGLSHQELADKTNQFWSKELPAIAINAAGMLPDSEKYTNIIIDEAQDLGTEEYLLFLSEMTRGTFSNAQKVFAVGDFTHQGIYLDGESAKETFISIEPKFQVLGLESHNCRNTRDVGEFVNELAELDPEYKGYLRSDDQGVASLIQYNSKIDLKNQLMARISDERSRYQEQQIVLLTDNRKALDEILQIPNPRFAPLAEPGLKLCRYGTVHEFKGLEAQCVFYIEMGNQVGKNEELLYVAATRTLGDFIYVTSKAK